ncbi:uncharacterized protein EV154DRAFT_570397 [Mucor mucedo]|uniref:uncharacterized protein n=1 Tax=Mucor mucedo TaxID=29922 RepID=UPI00221E6E4B|nr:uncharacterized protein EV154DRAFT_570397 [Mucor mucedo]KAI7873125.1 hypothetical protein EV154DRAFT_570397 [Mucor mucedo]
MYNHVAGIDRDYRMTISCFQANNQKIEKGHMYYLMGFMYEINGDGVVEDYLKALDSYTKAAEHGCVDVASMMANMHSQGYKGKVNLSEVVMDRYRKALEGVYDLA